MLRERTSGISGSAPEPPKPPVKKGNTITFEIDSKDGELVLNNSGDGITYSKVTTNISNLPEVSGSGGKIIKVPFDVSNNSAQGSTTIKIKAYVEKYDPEINSFGNVGIGIKYYEFAKVIIDFSDFDANAVTSIHKFMVKEYYANLIRLELIGLDSTSLVSIVKKNSINDTWGLGIFENVFLYDAELIFTNFNTPKLDSIRGILQNTGIKTADLSGLDTTNVTDMEYLFSWSGGITSIKMMHSVDKVIKTGNMFIDIPSKGTFTYNKSYNYDKLPIPKGWTKTPV